MDENGNIADKSYSKLLSKILKLQYPKDCLSPDNKYLILNHQCHVGLLSSIECLTYYLLMSIFLDRTLILNGSWTFGDDATCTHNNGNRPYENSMDCFFIPITNCSAELILNNEYKKTNPSIFILTVDNIHKREVELMMRIDEIWFHADPGLNINQNGLTERILLMPTKTNGGYGWRRIHRNSITQPIDIYLRKYFDLNHIDYIALAKVFLLRMTDRMKKLVYDKVNETLSGWMEFDGDDSLSVMINWHLDCKERIKEEYWKCFEYQEWMNVVQILKIIQPNLKYVIFVSEDLKIYKQIEEIYGEWMNNIGIKFIGKVGDVLNGYSLKHTNAVREILVAMQLQFVSKYHLLSRLEHWTLDFYQMKEKLNCTVYNDKDNKNNMMIKEDYIIYLDGDHESHFIVWEYELSRILAKMYHSNPELQTISMKNKLSFE